MTAAVEGTIAPKKPAWYTRPGIVLSLLGVLVFITALFAQGQPSGRNGDARLTSYSTQPLGAKLLFELVQKLGLKAERESRAVVPDSATAIYAVLNPVVALTRTDVHNVLDFVRNGGALLVVLGDGTDALSDSLRIFSDGVGGIIASNMTRHRDCTTTNRFNTEGLWFAQTATLFGLKGAAVDSMQAQVFESISSNRDSTNAGGMSLRFHPVPAIVGFNYGAGRIVVASDPDVYRNDALRDCRQTLDIVAVHVIQYLQGGTASMRRRIVFDEYRQNGRAGTFRLVRTYLADTPSGHSVLQLCIAGLLLMLGAAIRTLPPQGTDDVVERRSPLEHVDALGRAYAQVDATRTATMRLVGGLQRRAERGAALRAKRANTPDAGELFLARVGEVKPALAADVKIVRHALVNTVSTAEFKEVGHAIERIEDALTRT